jgi:hypothetical protein
MCMNERNQSLSIVKNTSKSLLSVTPDFRRHAHTSEEMSLLLISNIPLEEHIGYWKDGRAVCVVAPEKPVPHQVLLNLQGDPTAKLEYIDGQGLLVVDMVFQLWAY